MAEEQKRKRGRPPKNQVNNSKTKQATKKPATNKVAPKKNTPKKVVAKKAAVKKVATKKVETKKVAPKKTVTKTNTNTKTVSKVVPKTPSTVSKKTVTTTTTTKSQGAKPDTQVVEQTVQENEFEMLNEELIKVRQEQEVKEFKEKVQAEEEKKREKELLRHELERQKRINERNEQIIAKQNAKLQKKREFKIVRKHTGGLKFINWLLKLLLLAVLVYVVIVARNLFILHEQVDRFNMTTATQNYYKKTITYYGEFIETSELYVKGSKAHYKSTLSNGKVEEYYYDNGNLYTAAYNNGEKYFERENRQIDFKIEPVFMIEDNILDYLKLAVSLSIQKEKMNGTECLYEKFLGTSTRFWIQVDSGLATRSEAMDVKTNDGKDVTVVKDTFYEFNIVKESDVTI